MLLMDVTPNGSLDRECWVWFAEAPFRPASYNIVFFKEAQLEISSDRFSPRPFYTLWSDLTLSEQELWGRLNRAKRKKVVGARKAGWLINVGNDDAEIRRFHAAQNAFAGDKQIGPPLPLEVFQRNAEHCLTAFVYGRDGQPISWLLYVLDKPLVRQWYSGSDVTHSPLERGFANSLLTWEMMLYFKKEGYETYDWGGAVLEPTSPAYSITQFKLEFGGDLVKRFDYSCNFGLSRGRRLWRRLSRGAQRYLSKTASR